MRKRTYEKYTAYQTELSARHLEEVRSLYTEMRGYKHDFHHHLTLLREQLKAGDIERAIRFVEELDERLGRVDTLLKTGNITVDAIFSAKLSQAKAKKIPCTVTAVVPEVLPFTDVELSILFGNLLDNAMEACEAVPEGERFLRIYCKKKGAMLYFSMMNAAGAKLQKRDGIFASKKAGVHGFGLRRAEHIVKAHGGWVKYNSEEGAFTTEFLVPGE